MDGYQFVEPTEPLPNKPWHDHFIDETAKTPAGQPNAGAAWCDGFLDAALADRLQLTSAKTPWEQWEPFLNCAVWAYLSPDSKLCGDERLVKMSQVWLDTLFKTLAAKPADVKEAATWQPNRLRAWAFHEYTIPLLEIEQRPALRTKLGVERIGKLRDIVMENVRLNTTPDAFNKLMSDSEGYINLITHPMAFYIHGWLLTGEKKFLQMSYRIIHTLGRDQLPNG
ncbi:MAG: hypothetical protein WC765_10305, partial [Phycisphaerae bacterium]